MSIYYEQSVQYYQSVTVSVSGLTVVKQEMEDELKEIQKANKKQTNHLEKFAKYLLKLETSCTTLSRQIEEKRSMDYELQQQNNLKLNQVTTKISELTITLSNNQNSYRIENYKKNQEISKIDEEKIKLEDNLRQLHYQKHQLAEDLAQELQNITNEKQAFKILSNEQLSKISQYQLAIQDQEDEDRREEQEEKDFLNEAKSEDEQAEQIKNQINQQTQKNIANFQAAISVLDANIATLKSNIAILEEQIRGMEALNIQYNQDFNQKKEQIQIEINVLIQKKNQLTIDVQTFKQTSVSELDGLTFQYNQLINDKNALENQVQSLESESWQLNSENNSLLSRIEGYKNDYQSLIDNFNFQFNEYTIRINGLISQYEGEKQSLLSSHGKLESQYIAHQLQYNQHMDELPQIKRNYEQTVINLNIKINETKVLISNYEAAIQKHEAVAQEYRPVYYVTQKNKGKYEAKKKAEKEGNEEEDEDSGSDDDDDSESESDDEHYTVQVKFLTKDKIITGKKKLKIELENGTFYLTFKGLLKKVEKDKTIILDTRKNASDKFNFSYKVKLFDEIDRKANEKLSIKGLKVHKMKVNKKKGTKIYLKVKREDSTAPHSAIQENVNYYGSYIDNSRTLVMCLRGMTIDVEGKMTGYGSDDRGTFKVDGFLDFSTNECKFTQTFGNGKVYLNIGRYENKTITGKWSEGLYSGPFSITTTQKIFVYKGWYEQSGVKTDMEFILMLKNEKSLDVEGEGTDAQGAFHWRGKIEKQGKVVLTKKYVESHSVKYTGQMEGKRITGMWDMDGTLGQFEWFQVKDEEYVKQKEVRNSILVKKIEPHRACGMNQQYYGTYTNEQGQLVVCTFTDFNIDLDGVVHGAGSDEAGKFTVFGQLYNQQNLLKFSKQYATFAIYFSTTWENNTFKGTWSYYENAHYGDFSMTYTPKITYYRGTFHQGGIEFDTDVKIWAKLNNQVDGAGQDDVGLFNWSGIIQDGKANLIKQYGSKKLVKYVGEIKGKQFSGTWSSQDQTGPFTFQELKVDVPVGEVRVNKRAGTNVNYFGSYEEPGQSGQLVQVILQGLNITSEGEISGSGQDSKGKYTVQGSLDSANNNVTITKYYESSYISFIGVASKNGSSITGKWSVYTNTHYGAFSLTSTKKIWNYKGTTTTEKFIGNKTENIEFFLMLTSKNTVEGYGNDSEGKYSWTGTIHSDGNANLQKKYPKYAYNFKGTVQGNKIKGRWETDKMMKETGTFEVEDQQ